MTKPDDLVNSVYRGDGDGMYPGLTKRELFAAMIMQGIVSRVGDINTSRGKAFLSIQAADALIEQLNETEK
jgi:hypothetical protein